MAIQIARNDPRTFLVDEKEERLVKSLVSQVAILESELEEKQNKSADFSVEIRNLLVEKERIAGEIAMASQELEGIKLKASEQYALENKILVEELKVTTQAILGKNSSLSSLEKDIVEKTAELESRRKAILLEKTSERTLMASIAEKRLELDALNSEIEQKNGLKHKLSGEISTILTQKEELAKVVSEKQEKESILNVLNAKINSLKDTEKDKEIEITTRNTKLESLRAELKSIEQEIAEKVKLIEAREGNVSLKESWLEEKEKTLRNAKTELESFYNRKISNVIF